MSLLLLDGYVATMDAARTVYDPGFVLVGDDGRIAALGPMVACPQGVDAERVDCRGHIVLPGLISLFERPWTHLFAGLAPADGLAAAMSEDDHALSAGLAAEALATGGVTTALAAVPDSEHDVAGLTRAALSGAGLRPVIATSDPGTTAAGDALLVRFDRPARAAGHAGEAAITAAWRLAREHGLKLVSRLWPDGATSAQMSAAQAEIGRSTPQHLMEMGVLDAGWLLVSPLGLSDMDRMLIRESGCSVVGLPLAEAAAGTGTTDLSALARAGVTCGLGTDGPGRGWTTDLIEQIKWAVMSQNTLSLDVTTMSAERALEMATVNAAKALGLDGRIGALAPGLLADIAVFDLTGPHFGVSVKPISHWITCAKAGDARLVLRGGKAIFRRGEPHGGADLNRAAEARRRILTTAGRAAA